jgi:transcriptional regulator with XRE-family HTH domain
MQDAFIGRLLRALRHRKGWRQSDLSEAASVSRTVIGSLEAGDLERHALGALRRTVQAAGGTLRLSIFVPGGDVERLMDADHARLQAQWKAMLERSGWTVEAEATFSVYGERGSIDLLAWHPETRTLLVIEIKTVIVEIGALLSTLDRKARLAWAMARDRGWAAASIVPALVVLEGSTARRRISEAQSLFGRFSLRGRSAMAWVADPAGRAGAQPTGVLVLSRLSDAHRGDRRRAGRQRVRQPGRVSRSETARGGPREGVDGA